MADPHEVIDGAQLVRELRLGERQAGGPLAVFRSSRTVMARWAAAKTPRRAAAGPTTSPCARRSPRAARSSPRSARAARCRNCGSSTRESARILVLDGEELRGAKQNRVLSTAILIDGYTTLVVPVSYTEQGRWAYASREFAESEILAERQVRFAMRSSSYASMRSGAGVHADQGVVWSEVAMLHDKQGTHSDTSAMRDAYEGRKLDSTERSPPSRSSTDRTACWCCTARGSSASTSCRGRRSTPSSTTNCCAATPSRRWCAAVSPAIGRWPRRSSRGSPCSGPALQEPRPRWECASTVPVCWARHSSIEARPFTPPSSMSAGRAVPRKTLSLSAVRAGASPTRANAPAGASRADWH